jgi:hypothetical protein
MTRYLISFDDGAMNHIPDEDWPAVGEASHGGTGRRCVDLRRRRGAPTIKVVAPDGAATAGPDPDTRQSSAAFRSLTCHHQEAFAWAAKIAVGCRCAQEVREIMSCSTRSASRGEERHLCR